MEIANQEPCEKTGIRMEIGHKPRSSALVGAAFNIRSTVLLPLRPFLSNYTITNKPSYFLFLQQRMSDTLV